jgi:hypothetical protein
MTVENPVDLGGQAAPTGPQGRVDGLFRAPFTASGGGSSRTNRCRITHPSRPVHQAIFAKSSIQSLQDRVERSFIPPDPEAIVQRLSRAQSFWPITPLGARAQNPENTLDHLTIITPGMPHVLGCRYNVLDPFAFCVTKLVPFGHKFACAD